jgi:hypothetical protein
VQRRDLDLLAARLAHDLVVDADEMVAQLGELGPVALVGARWQPVLLDPAHPADAVLVGPPAARAGHLGRTGLGAVGEESAFVERHPVIIPCGTKNEELTKGAALDIPLRPW